MSDNEGMLFILEQYENDEYRMQDGLTLDEDDHLPPLTRESVIAWLEDHGVVFQTENAEPSQVRDKPEGVVRDDEAE